MRIKINLGVYNRRLPVNEVTNIFRESFFARHRRAVYQDRNYRNVFLEGRLNFDTDPIIAAAEPRFSCPIIPHPVWTNDR